MATAENNLICECGYQTRNSMAFLAHKKIHKNGKYKPQKKGIFPCLFCDKFFETQSALNGHKQVHPRIIGCAAINQDENEEPQQLLEYELGQINENLEIQEHFEKQKAILSSIKPQYTVIPANVYKSKALLEANKISDFPQCECDNVCDSNNCILGRDLVECHRETCRAKECTNNKITLAKTQDVYVKETQVKGLAVFAQNDIPAGTFILEYIGQVIDKKECDKRKIKNVSQFIIEIKIAQKSKMTSFIDAKNCGNATAFINHSCEPNCQHELWVAENLPRVAIYSLKNITRFFFSGNFGLCR